MSIEELQAWHDRENARCDEVFDDFNRAKKGTPEFEAADEQLTYHLGRVSVLREMLKQLQAVGGAA